MEHLLTKLTASLTELREPNKVIAKAGNQPVAIMNRNEAILYRRVQLLKSNSSQPPIKNSIHF